jgi:hypothetical protein
MIGKALCFIALCIIFFLTTVTSTLAASEGNWAGLTSQNRPVSFSVSGSGVVDFAYQIGIDCGFAIVTISTTVSGITIIGNSFSTSSETSACNPSQPWNTDTITFSGSFTDDNTCDGTWSVENAGSGTWQAELDTMTVTPTDNVTVTGVEGGPFTPGLVEFAVTNTGSGTIAWEVSSNQTWLTVSPLNGNLSANASVTVMVSPNGEAEGLQIGSHSASLNFEDTTNGVSYTRGVDLSVYAASDLIFDDDFEEDKGWILTGEFERDAPGGIGGEHGNPDPASAFQGINVLGTDLTGLGSELGDYEASISDRAYTATSPTVDCSNFSDVLIRFRRWLNVEEPSWDHAYIDVSNDNGVSWNQVWTNAITITDSSWNEQSVDISEFADGQSQIKVRFSLGSTDSSWFFSGWNIDSFQVRGSASTKGDINGDGSVDLQDAIVALKILSSIPVSGIQKEADIDDDKVIGVMEAIYILQKVGMIR